MSTTIDNVQIKISSSSADAAQAISQLSDALSGLKSKELGDVSTGIGSIVNAVNGLGSSTAGIQMLSNLATSLGKLSLVKIPNSIPSTLNALASLKSVAVPDSFGSSLGNLANDLGQLSNVNIQSSVPATINSIIRLNKASKDLSDGSFGKFGEQVKKISSALEPLENKSYKAAEGVRAISKSATEAAESGNKMAKALDYIAKKVNAINFETFTHFVSRFKELYGKFSGEAIEWEGISQRFARGFGDTAQDTIAWVDKIDDALTINKQQLMQYASLYSVMLKGFGVATEDAQIMARGYTELAYDIWAGYNDIYSSYEETAQAIQSAITGQVKSIRRAGFDITQATLEETAANHGLEISISDATQAQKSYLRYLTLVDQAHSQNLIGEYAREMNTAEGVTRTLAQQLKTLGQVAGSALLPLLTKAIPYITAFVKVVGDAIKYVASLFGVTIQAIDWDWDGFVGAGDSLEDSIDGMASGADDLANGMGGAAAAAKEYKKTILGIDEINPLNAQNLGGGGGSGGSGGSGGGGGTSDSGLNWDVGSLWTDAIFDSVNNQVDAAIEKVKTFIPLVEAVAGSLAMWKVPSALTIALEGLLEFRLSSEYLESGNLYALLGEAFVAAAGTAYLYKKMGDKGIIIGIATAVVAQIVSIGFNLAEGNVTAEDPQLWIQSAFTTLLGGYGTGLFFKKASIGSPGIGFGIGATVSLSLVATALTFGLEAQGNTTGAIISSLCSVLSAALAGALIGSVVPGVGTALGATVGLAISVVANTIALVAGKNKNAQLMIDEAAKKQLAENIGTIDLTSEEVKAWVSSVKLVPKSVTIDGSNMSMSDAVTMKVSVKADMEKAYEDVKTQLQLLNEEQTKLDIGLSINAEEWSAQLEKFIASSQNFLDKEHLEARVSLGMLGMSNSDLAGFEQSSYEKNKNLIDQLYGQIQDVASTGKTVSLATGVEVTFDDPEAAITEFERQINDIILAAAQRHYEANLESIEIRFGGKTSLESRKAFIEEYHKNTQEMVDALGDSLTVDIGIALDMKDSGDLEGYKKAMQELAEKYNAEVLPLIKDEAIQVQKQIQEVMNGTMGSLTSYVDVSHFQGTFVELKKQMESGLGNVTDAVKERAAELWEAVAPTAAQTQDAIGQARSLGENVPKELSNSLNEQMQLGYLAGDAEAMNYMIGYELTQGDSFSWLLTSTQDAFGDLPQSALDGIYGNIKILRDGISGEITGIADMNGNLITGTVTPTLLKNLQDLGVDIGNQVSTIGDVAGDEAYNVIASVKENIILASGDSQKEIMDAMRNAGFNSIDAFIYELNQGNPLAYNAVAGLSDSAKKAFIDGGVDLNAIASDTSANAVNNYNDQYAMAGTVSYNKVKGFFDQSIKAANDSKPGIKKANQDTATAGIDGFVNTASGAGALARMNRASVLQMSEYKNGILKELAISNGVSSITKGYGLSSLSGFEKGSGDAGTIKKIKDDATSVAKGSLDSMYGMLFAQGAYKTHKYGVDSMSAYASGIKSGSRGVYGTVNDITSGALNIVRGSYDGFYQVGSYLAQGVIRGMQGYGYFRELRNWVNGLLLTTQRYADIGSPSKLFEDEVGYWLAAGVAKGADQPDILIAPLSDMLDTTTKWWEKNASLTPLAASATYSFDYDTDEQSDMMYESMKDANTESEALLREQNKLLRQLLDKDTSVNAYISSREVMSSFERTNRRAGKTVVAMDY